MKSKICQKKNETIIHITLGQTATIMKQIF